MTSRKSMNSSLGYYTLQCADGRTDLYSAQIGCSRARVARQKSILDNRLKRRKKREERTKGDWAMERGPRKEYILRSKSDGTGGSAELMKTLLLLFPKR